MRVSQVRICSFIGLCNFRHNDRSNKKQTEPHSDMTGLESALRQGQTLHYMELDRSRWHPGKRYFQDKPWLTCPAVARTMPSAAKGAPATTSATATFHGCVGGQTMSWGRASTTWTSCWEAVASPDQTLSTSKALEVKHALQAFSRFSWMLIEHAFFKAFQTFQSFKLISRFQLTLFCQTPSFFRKAAPRILQGSVVHSKGLVILDEPTCVPRMVWVIRDFLLFWTYTTRIGFQMFSKFP